MNEEEAIEQLKKIKNNIDKKYINTKNSNAIETVLNLLEKKDKEIQYQKEINKTEQERHKQTEKSLKGQFKKKDKIIDEIQEEVLDHIGFENRLKRDNREPDLFNQGRFYVANNINNILKGKVENGN